MPSRPSWPSPEPPWSSHRDTCPSYHIWPCSRLKYIQNVTNMTKNMNSPSLEDIYEKSSFSSLQNVIFVMLIIGFLYVLCRH